MTGKSKEEIAFELVSKLKGVGVWGENNMGAILDMYAECLEATSGLRKTKATRDLSTQAQPNPHPVQAQAMAHSQTPQTLAPQQQLMAQMINPAMAQR